MGEYEDRYPEAFGPGEETDSKPAQRRFFGFGPPRQMRDNAPEVAEAPEVDRLPEPARAKPRPAHERPRRVLIARSPPEIRDDVFERLNDSPLVDASGISISVDGSEVTLAGTINSLFAVSVAQALASN